MVSLSKKGEKETDNTQHHHKGQRWPPTALLWASGKPAMAQNPPVSGNPVCFAVSCASSRGHKQIPGNTGNVCSLRVMEKFWNSERGEGGREAWANKESFKDKHARTLAFHLPFPGLTDRVTLWPQPHQLHTNQNQTLSLGHQQHRHCSLCSSHQDQDQDPQGQCTEREQYRQGPVNEELGVPFMMVSFFMVSVPCGQNQSEDTK